MCALSGRSEEADRFGGHLGVFLVGATRVGGDVDRGAGGFHQVVAEEVVFDFLARNVGDHHAIDLDAGGQRLTGLLHHFRVVGAVVDDVDVLVRQAVLAQDGTHSVGPAAGRFEIGFDNHELNVGTDKSGASYRAAFPAGKRKF